jgi:hypothetical protein
MLANPLCCYPGKGQWMQFNRLKRREFITLLGGAAVAWPVAGRAQQDQRMRRIGMLMNGPEAADQFRLAAGYIDRILGGEKPADLPVQAPTKYDLVINLKTAKVLGITVPPMLLARADEVIE